MQVQIVLDIPSPEYIHSLLSTFSEGNFLSRFKRVKEDDEHSVKNVFHLCGNGVLEDLRYQEFMRGFSSETYVCNCSVWLVSYSSISYRPKNTLTTLCSLLHQP